MSGVRFSKTVLLGCILILLSSCSLFNIEWEGTGVLLNSDAHTLAVPEWSPDGTAIAFVAVRGSHHPESQIDVYDLQTRTVHTAVSYSGNSEAHWSLNGEMIAYGYSPIEFLLMPDQQHLGALDGYAGGWTRTGEIFTITRSKETNVVELLMYDDINSMELVSTVRLNSRHRFGSFGGISISSTHILVALGSGSYPPGLSDEKNIVVYTWNGDHEYTLGSEDTDDYDPSIFPNDNNWLIYLEMRKFDNGAYVFSNLSGSCQYRGDYSGERKTGISFSPDGQRLALTIRDKLIVIPFEEVFGMSATSLIGDCNE